MKKLILTTSFVFATVTSITLFAQEKKQSSKNEIKVDKPKDNSKKNQAIKNKSPEQRADVITKRMMRVTSASSDKEIKIREINLETEKQREVDRTTNANNKDGLKVAHKKRNVEREQKLKEVFSADEYSKWVEHKKEMKAKHMTKKQDAKKTKTDVEEEILETIE